MITEEPLRSSRWLGRRYLFHIGRLRIPSFAALLYVGFAVGVVWGGYVCGLGYLPFAISALALLVFALVGARIWFLVGHPEFVADRTGVAVMTNAGAGLYGALALSFAASWPVLGLTGLEFWRFWDGGAVVLLVGMVVTRMGCLMNGCCSGRATSGPLGIWLPDDRGEWKRRYPAPLFEAAWSALILDVGVALHRPSDPAGLLFLGSAAAYGLGRLGLELLRADATRTGRPTRMNLAFSAVLALVSIAAFGLRLH
ncbi:prolipoprotein diacylglyceryl transferase family protein [Mycobacterium shigaense]|uniref:prolipoprotein diacylglyceryl transferase family protein n=1 Tax=Mycobacterium shigaense TaxID=722731 RepID=UPI000E582E9A|nr:prolipoprotein diacylglyceryl transferase family protein [Mycobacterium shigaense]MEA1122190.1 prolipoprotein diacylglyceryl transferase family protein [Mycobacterium shigaense]